MEQQFNFKAEQLEKQIPKLKSLGITEFSIHDLELSKNKTRLLHIINLIEKYAKDVFVNLLVDNSIIDKEIINAALKIFCSIDIPILIEKKRRQNSL
jgi:hypothetical protein